MQQVMGTIYSWWDDLEKLPSPMGGLKFGELDKECTGIAVCWQATSNILAQAADGNLNLFITHEGLLWEPQGVDTHGTAEIPTADKPGNRPDKG